MSQVLIKGDDGYTSFDQSKAERLGYVDSGERAGGSNLPVWVKPEPSAPTPPSPGPSPGPSAPVPPAPPPPVEPIVDPDAPAPLSEPDPRKTYRDVEPITEKRFTEEYGDSDYELYTKEVELINVKTKAEERKHMLQLALQRSSEPTPNEVTYSVAGETVSKAAYETQVNSELAATNTTLGQVSVLQANIKQARAVEAEFILKRSTVDKTIRKYDPTNTFKGDAQIKEVKGEPVGGETTASLSRRKERLAEIKQIELAKLNLMELEKKAWILGDSFSITVDGQTITGGKAVSVYVKKSLKNLEAPLFGAVSGFQRVEKRKFSFEKPATKIATKFTEVISGLASSVTGLQLGRTGHEIYDEYGVPVSGTLAQETGKMVGVAVGIEENEAKFLANVGASLINWEIKDYTPEWQPTSAIGEVVSRAMGRPSTMRFDELLIRGAGELYAKTFVMTGVGKGVGYVADKTRRGLDYITSIVNPRVMEANALRIAATKTDDLFLVTTRTSGGSLSMFDDTSVGQFIVTTRKGAETLADGFTPVAYRSLGAVKKGGTLITETESFGTALAKAAKETGEAMPFKILIESGDVSAEFGLSARKIQESVTLINQGNTFAEAWGTPIKYGGELFSEGGSVIARNVDEFTGLITKAGDPLKDIKTFGVVSEAFPTGSTTIDFLKDLGESASLTYDATSLIDGTKLLAIKKLGLASLTGKAAVQAGIVETAKAITKSKPLITNAAAEVKAFTAVGRGGGATLMPSAEKYDVKQYDGYGAMPLTKIKGVKGIDMPLTEFNKQTIISPPRVTEFSDSLIKPVVKSKDFSITGGRTNTFVDIKTDIKTDVDSLTKTDVKLTSFDYAWTNSLPPPPKKFPIMPWIPSLPSIKGGGGWSFKVKKTGKRRIASTPSMTALFMGLTGKVSKASTTKSGLEIRPITLKESRLLGYAKQEKKAKTKQVKKKVKNLKRGKKISFGYGNLFSEPTKSSVKGFLL